MSQTLQVTTPSARTRFFGQTLAIVAKDLTLERRSKASLNALVFLACLILVIVSFALGPDQARLRSVSGAVLWIALAFAGVLAFSRGYQLEAENRAFEGMLLAGANPRAIYLGKLGAAMAVMLVVEAVMLPIMTLLFGVHIWGNVGWLVLTALLGTLGLAAIGVLYGRLTMNLRAREVMLPVLVFPVVIPAILASVKATGLIIAG